MNKNAEYNTTQKADNKNPNTHFSTSEFQYQQKIDAFSGKEKYATEWKRQNINRRKILIVLFSLICVIAVVCFFIQQQSISYLFIIFNFVLCCIIAVFVAKYASQTRISEGKSPHKREYMEIEQEEKNIDE